MHAEPSIFVESLKNKFPNYFKNKKVLEVGSLNINGSVRQFFKNCDYIGIDLGEGPGVDIICPIHKFKKEREFDVVISTEMLEHDQHWRESLIQMYENLKPSGILILTCAGPERPEHGTTRTSPSDAPFTNDWYRNISVEDFYSILKPKLFSNSELGYVRNGADLMFWGIKRE